MIRFGNIPMALRTPLFFGEISINGNNVSLGSCTIQKPSNAINCTGATSSVCLGYAMVADADVSNLVMTTIIDDVVLESDWPAYLSITATAETPDIDPLTGYVWVPGVMTITNTDAFEHRVEFKSNLEEVALVLYDNPCAIQFTNQHTGTCLSVGESDGISCDGAYPYLAFTAGANKYWDITINGTKYDTGNEDIIAWVSNNIGLETGLVAMDYSESMGLWIIGTGLTSGTTKIILTPKVSDPVIEFFESTDMGITANPAAFIQNNIVYACLAASSASTTNLFFPTNIINSGEFIVGTTTNNSVKGIYALEGMAVNVDTNYASVALGSNVQFSSDDSVLVSKYGVKLARNSATQIYDTELSFDPVLTDSPDIAVSFDGSYILTANISSNVQIYKKQSNATYLKVGEVTGYSYFTGLNFSPESSKFSFLSLGSGVLAVFDLVDDVANLIGTLEYTDPLTSAKTVSTPIWLSDSVIARSYVYKDSSNVNVGGYLETIEVDSDAATVTLKSKIDIGEKYYRFEKPQQSRCLVTTDTGELRLLGIDGSYVYWDLDYSAFANRYYVLKSNGTQLILDSQTENQVDIITINDDGTYS